MNRPRYKLSVCRNATWNGQCVRFHSFMQLQTKMNLTFRLVDEGRKICRDDTVEKESRLLRSLFLRNAYPENTIIKVMKKEIRRKGMRLITRPMYVPLHSKFDIEAENIQRRLSDPVSGTFFVAQLKSVFISKPVMHFQLKDALPDFAA